MLRTFILLALVASCGGRDADATDEPIPGDTDRVSDDTDPGPWVRPERGDRIVELFDGVRVPSRYEPASEPERPAIILLHGADPRSSRHEWPEEIIMDLVARDYTVLVPDVRGCGEAEGDAAALGTFVGIRDLRRYMEVVHEDGYGRTIVIAGTGSDGTMTGYAYRDDTGQEDLPLFAMGYLTSHVPRVVEGLATLREDSDRPVLFMYPSNVGAWAESKRQVGNPAWTFLRYPPGGINTDLFKEWASPEAAEDLVNWIDSVLQEG